MSHLMRPLGSADLKPRGYQQAAESPAIAPEPAEEAAQEVLPAFEPPVQPEPVLDEMPVPEEEPSFDFSLLDDFGRNEPEDDEDADEPDAVPSEHMPEPVCVDLFAFDAPGDETKKKTWLWVLPVLLAAALVAAVWHFGLVSKLYAFIIDKTSAMGYNLGTISFSFKPK